MNGSIHTETTFESAIIEHLTNNGWLEGKAENFSSEIGLDKNAVLDFIQTSQLKEWDILKSYYNEETENKFIQRLFKELDLRGMLDVIRHGITDSGIKFKLAYFKPDSGLNPDTLKQYSKNNLSRFHRFYALVFSDLLYYHRKRKYVTDVTDLFLILWRF